VRTEAATTTTKKPQRARACFSQIFSRKMWHFFRESEKWRKIVLFAVRNAAKMVQFWAVSWVEPAFRDFVAKIALTFAERIAAKNGALLLAKNGEKWHFFSRSEMRRKWRFDVGE
jgi:hypothetical protein